MIRETRALVLAAGKGSRLGPLTADLPKCLLRVKERTLLDWQLDALRSAGIKNVGIVTGYKSELLQLPGLTTFHNDEWQSTNMLMSLFCARAWMSENDCIISYADILYEPALVTSLRQTVGDIVVPYNTKWQALWENRFDDPLLDAETFQFDNTRRLTEIGKKTKTIQEIQGQYMGMIRFSPRGWNEVERLVSSLPRERVQKMDMTTLLGLLIPRIRIDVFPSDTEWYEVDNERDYQIAESQFRRR